MSTELGYARVSTRDENHEGGRDALAAARAERVFVDTITGTALARAALDRLLSELQPGDERMLSRLGSVEGVINPFQTAM